MKNDDPWLWWDPTILLLQFHANVKGSTFCYSPRWIYNFPTHEHQLQALTKEKEVSRRKLDPLQTLFCSLIKAISVYCVFWLFSENEADWSTTFTVAEEINFQLIKEQSQQKGKSHANVEQNGNEIFSIFGFLPPRARFSFSLARCSSPEITFPV